MTKVLMVVTSHSNLGDTGEKTGFWWEELAAPYSTFEKQGFDIDIASPKGGKPPADPRSDPAKLEDKVAASVVRQFQSNVGGMAKLNNSIPLAKVDPNAYDAVFFVGGHGTMWDFPDNPDIKNIIKNLDERQAIIAAVCHGPAAFIGAVGADEQPIVFSRKVTAFSNMEERLVNMMDAVPYLLEDQLTEMGGNYITAEPWKNFSVASERLITGQNPMSSATTAMNVVDTLQLYAPAIQRRAKSA